MTQWLLILAICVSIVGCKKKSGSSVQSLDNLAGTNKVVNACRDAKGSTENSLIPDQSIIIRKDVEATMPQTTQEAYRKEVDTYFSALPPEMQDLFLRMGGKVFLTPDASGICGKMFSDQNSDQYTPDEERRKTESCFVFTGQQSASNYVAIQQTVMTGAALPQQVNKDYFVIVHQIYPNKSGEDQFTAIRHGGVRVFGFIYAQLLSRLGQRTMTNGITAMDINPLRDNLRNYKLNLGISFMRDLSRTKNQNYKPENIDFLLGPGQTNVLMQAVAGNSSMTPAQFDQALSNLNFPGNKDVMKGRFLDYLFGEAFDSTACSNDARAVLARDFGESKKIIEPAFAFLKGEFTTSLLKVFPKVPMKGERKAGRSSSNFALAAGDPYPSGTYPPAYLNQGTYPTQYPGQVYPTPGSYPSPYQPGYPSTYQPGYPSTYQPGYPSGYPAAGYPGYPMYPQQNVSPLLQAFMNPAIQAQISSIIASLGKLGGGGNVSPTPTPNNGGGGKNTNNSANRLADDLASGGCPGGNCSIGGDCSGGNCSSGGCSMASGGCSGGSCGV